VRKTLRKSCDESELVRRYKQNYSIPQEVRITERMILAHWELEEALTKRLRNSTPENRWHTFAECYSRLYGELDWLNAAVGQDRAESPQGAYLEWRNQLGPPPKRIYEIGAGKGELILYLAEQGFICRAAEITTERGEQVAGHTHERLSWSVSDGVHLTRFEPAGNYDAVVSDQVLEHLHPDDLTDHLQSVYDLLRLGGSYVFRTPHRFTGPHDISRLFGYRQAGGMHLKEYTFAELVDRLEVVGFTRIQYVLPRRAQHILQRMTRGNVVQPERIAKTYLALLVVTERLLQTIPVERFRVQCARLLTKTPLFRDSIFLEAVKL
jgi:2-polyprenyl-3-methyl-5-hydroxy-6-metoxy-1,4-benzoquinol methylase